MKYLILIIGFLLITSTAQSATDSELCMEFKNFEKMTNKNLPQKIDEYTEVVTIGVNCESKSIKYTKQLLFYENMMAEGWKERKQRQHTQLHCNKDGLSRTVKWTAIDVMYDNDFQYLGTLTTSPTDCD